MNSIKNQYSLSMREMKAVLLLKRMKTIMILMAFLACASFSNAQIPHLMKNEYGATQLIVYGKPFLMLAGEVHNSSGSDIPHMERIMKDLNTNNLNSVLVSVSWEIIEPQDGIFNFTSVDELIRIARENDIKLCLLWFASWKNGLSPYAPLWVLSDTKRFIRVKDDQGNNTKTLTPLCNATRDADARAFSELLKHIAAVDSKENTIIFIQIENEVGVLHQTRDFSDEANKAFSSQVPAELIQYMLKNKNTLEVELKTSWESNGSKTKGTWTEVFGQGDDADLFFMAWHYCRYLNYIVEAGKKAYNIPMYANCWMCSPRPNPGKPGEYPSGGPILSVLDIWKAGTASIDMLAPDIYGQDFAVQVNNFHRHDNPLFIPETRAAEGPASFVFAQHDAICFSPFGIDNSGSTMAQEYALLDSIMPVITKYQGSGKMSGFYSGGQAPTEQENNSREIQLNDDVKISISFSRGLRRPSAAATENSNNQLGGRQQESACYGIFIQTGENEFILAGKNLSVTASSANPQKIVWLKDAREGTYDENGQWKTIALHNGDEAGFLRGDSPSYRIGRYQTNPTEPAIFKFKVVVNDK
jgi:hypothetical protein